MRDLEIRLIPLADFAHLHDSVMIAFWSFWPWLIIATTKPLQREPMAGSSHA